MRDNVQQFNVKWVKLAHYCDLTGDTPQAVHNRRYRGEWLEGVHYVIRKRHIWVNLQEAQNWVEKGHVVRYVNR